MTIKPKSREIAALARALYEASNPDGKSWGNVCVNQDADRWFEQAERVALAMHANGHSINA